MFIPKGQGKLNMYRFNNFNNEFKEIGNIIKSKILNMNSKDNILISIENLCKIEFINGYEINVRYIIKKGDEIYEMHISIFEDEIKAILRENRLDLILD